MEEWIPKTDLGKKVRARLITDINEILDNGITILEPQIADTLIPGMEAELLLVGQSKGKFGGGRRRVFRQTQKKTREGNKPRFAAYAVIGNGDGILGLGYGKARETVPAREKAIRKAKINLFKVARGSGSWESSVKEPHTVPFTVEGKCGSVVVRLIPAPKGKGLVAEKEVQKILAAAGIQDVWSQTFGQTKNKINLIKATEQALRKLASTRLRDRDISNLSVVYGNSEEIAIASEEMVVGPKEGKSEKRVEQQNKTKVANSVAVSNAEKIEPKKVSETKKSTGTPLTEVTGVGEKAAETLKAAGIDTAEKLASVDIKTLSGLEGFGEATAEKVLGAAKEVSK